ncbi:MAG: tRNA pseudouridine(13) synthase TruD [Phycisphaeraceae bacterium]
MPRATDHLAYLTADAPGTGGMIKVRPQDFLVEEQPLYEPCGEGEHLYLFIEKQEQTTSDVMRRLAKMFGVRRGDIGYAGLKDKHAITRQHFSIYKPDPSDDERLLGRVQFTRFKLLWSARHTNKLRRGHLRGNRFVIYIRDVKPTDVIRAKPVFDHLIKVAAPNYIGDQRFGYRQNNHILGKHYILSQWQELLDEMLSVSHESDPPERYAARQAYRDKKYFEALETWARHFHHDRQALDALRQGKSDQRAVMAIDPVQREFMISSLQSAIFNHVVDNRVRRGAFNRLVSGDLAWKHDSRAVFAVDDATAAKENAPGGRIERLEISPSGPMWGCNMTRPEGEPGQWEREAVESLGLTVEQLCESPQTVDGTRRPLRMMIRDPDISGGGDEHGPFIRVAFELPRGSFATMVLREIMKPCIDAPREEQESGRESDED